MSEETETAKPADVAGRLDGLVRQEARSKIGGILIEKHSGVQDNLAIALCSYFSSHMDRPESDPETEHGWGAWVEQKANDALDLIVSELLPNAEVTGAPTTAATTGGNE
jgi:hypothetical protein